MSHTRNKPPLGAVLQQAGLVSAEQIERAIEQQKKTHSSLRIGEILALQGRIDPQTASFFAERWESAVTEQPKQPIGQYLKQAGLLNERQIETILAQQKHTERKFGELAIAKGWLKQVTVDFFLRYLYSESNLAPTNESKSTVKFPTTVDAARNLSLKSQNLELDEKQDYSQKVHEGFLQIKRKLLKIESQNTCSEKILERVLSWTGGHSLLTQKIFALIANNDTPVSSTQEEEQVDYLVQTKIIDNWSNNELKSHLQGIENRLIDNQQCSSKKLLLLYQKILTETVLLDDSCEQQELLSLGLVVKQHNRLAVANRIYRSVFDLSWTIEALNSQVRDRLGRDESLGDLHGKSNLIAESSTTSESKDSWLNFKNLLLLLTLLGLFCISVDNIFKRITVRKSFQKGNELLKQKSFTEALDEYNKLLNIDSNYFQAWTNRGYALAGLQKYGQMRESCSTATIINPDAVYAWNCQGEALHNLKQYEEAVTAFERAIALNQSDPIFSINKGESLRALGENEASTASIEQAVRVLEGIEALEGSNKIKGEFAVALTLLGNNHRQQSNYQEAIAAYDRAIQYSPNYFPARVSKGITLSKAERYSAAESEFELILEDNSLTPNQQAQVWFYLGKTRCKSAQHGSGEAAFERALELNPDYAIAIDAKKQCR